MTNINTFPGDTQGRNILKSRTINHGVSGSGEVDTYTLNPGENLIILNNHQGSAGSSRSYAANFTAGVPTALGTVLHLEINSSRTNNSSSQIAHRTQIQFGGTAYLDTGNIAVFATGNAKDAYQRKLQRTIVLTVSGWVDFSLGSRIGTVAAATDIIFKTNENVGQAATGSDSVDVERMRITSTGNVGISTAAPGEKLHVHENLSASGHQIAARIGGATSSFNTLVFGAYNGKPHVGGHRGDFGEWADLSLQNGLMSLVQSTMFVGIGTATPRNKLNVVGRLQVGSVTTTNNTACIAAGGPTSMLSRGNYLTSNLDFTFARGFHIVSFGFINFHDANIILTRAFNISQVNPSYGTNLAGSGTYITISGVDSDTLRFRGGTPNGLPAQYNDWALNYWYGAYVF